MIKYSSVAEHEDVLKLLGNAGFKRPLIEWQFSQCSGRRPIVAVEENQVIGFNGIMPVRVWLKDEIVNAAWSCDFIVSPDRRRQGIGRKLKEALDQDWPLIMALGISQVGQLASRKAGWKPGRGPRRFSRLLKGKTWRNVVLCKLQRLICWCLSEVLRNHVQRLSVSEIQDLPARELVDELLEDVINDYEACVVRDWTYLNWRYVTAPYNNYFFLPVRSGEKLVGLGIATRIAAQITLVDFLGPRNNSEVKKALIDFLIHHESDAQRLNCATSDPGMQLALLRSGFLPARTAKIVFHVRDNRKIAHPETKRWFLMGGDSDTEMLEQARYKWGGMALSVWREKEFAISCNEWNDLLESAAGDPLFMSWQWQYAWWMHFSAQNALALRIVAVRDSDSRLVALAPFCYRQTSVYGLPTNRLEALGNLWQGPGTMRSEYLEPLVHPDWLQPASALILDALCAQNDHHELVYSDTPETSRSADYLFSAMRSRFLVRKLVRPQEDETRFISLPDSFSCYIKSLGANTRRRMFGRRKFLDGLGVSRFDYATTDSLDSFFSDLNEFHIRRWGKPAFSGKTLEFQQHIAQIMLASGMLRFSRLSIDGKTVSLLYNMIANNREYNLQLGFDQDFYPGKLSLGLLHLGFAIQEAIREGRAEFDLLAGAGKKEHYKYRITNRGTQLCTWHIIRPEWRQLVYAAKSIRTSSD